MSTDWVYDAENTFVQERYEPHREVCNLGTCGFSPTARDHLGHLLARTPHLKSVLLLVKDLVEQCWQHDDVGRRIEGENPRSCAEVLDELLAMSPRIYAALGMKEPRVATFAHRTIVSADLLNLIHDALLDAGKTDLAQRLQLTGMDHPDYDDYRVRALDVWENLDDSDWDKDDDILVAPGDEGAYVAFWRWIPARDEP